MRIATFPFLFHVKFSSVLPLFFSSFSPNASPVDHLIQASPQAASKAATAPASRGGTHNLKEIKFSNEGRASILKGVDVLGNAVSITLCSKGA